MALPLVHLMAAMLWAENKPDLRDCPEFYLGAIAPDAMHIRFGGDKSRKNEFHLGNWTSPHPDEIYAYWRERFTPFDIGYGVHALTDAAWVPGFRRALPELLDENGRVIPEIYYRDTWDTEYRLLKAHPELMEVLRAVEIAKAPADHIFLSAEEIDAWRAAVLDAYLNPKSVSGEAEYITLPYVEQFIRTSQSFLQDITGRYFFMDNAVLRAIADRRSIRSYSDAQITDEQLDALLTAAVQSPTAVNAQPWHFTAVQNAELLNQFNEDHRRLMLERAPEHMRERFQDPNISVFHHAPTVIFISLPNPLPSPFTPIDAGIAAENIALAAHSMGLGTVILGMPRVVFESELADQYRRAFHFPEGHEYAIAVAVGIPTASKEAHEVKPDRVEIIR